jgi:hypothetical protein
VPECDSARNGAGEPLPGNLRHAGTALFYPM